MYKKLKPFLFLWGGQAVSSFGSALTAFAVAVWAYDKQGTAASVAFLSMFSNLPSIFLCFIAGPLTDRWSKKKIIFISELVAAAGTLVIFFFLRAGGLELWYIYAVNFAVSLTRAFAGPASYVAVSLLVPKELYMRASGMQALSGSVVSVLTPLLAGLILSRGGLESILIIDAASFAVYLFMLLFLVRIPRASAPDDVEKVSFFRSCFEGFGFLREHMPLLKIILFFSFINLLAYMTGFGILPAMMLARGGQTAYSMVSSAIGFGTLAGSLLVTLMKTPSSKTRVIFLSCGISFVFCDLFWGIGSSVWIWIIGAFVGNAVLPFLNVNLSTIMRLNIPAHMQGRVFSTRDTIQFSTIPLGLFLGGILADNVFEPLMMGGSNPLQSLLAPIVGQGIGSGMAVMFIITGVLGSISSFLCLRDRNMKTLDI